MTHSILLAVDDSPASHEAIGYLSSWLAGSGATVHVVHVLPHAAGAEAAERETSAERWLAMSREQAQPVLMRSIELLKSHGLDPGGLEDGFLYLRPETTAADGLIEAARERGCKTLVVGRNALPWHREVFHHHIADELVEKAKGLTIWVVE